MEYVAGNLREMAARLHCSGPEWAAIECAKLGAKLMRNVDSPGIEEGVFLCCVKSDECWVEPFAVELQDVSDCGCFRGYDQPAEEVAQQDTDDALRASRAVVFVLSVASVGSPWTSFVLGAAVAGSKDILSVAIEHLDDEAIPPLLQRHHVLKVTSPTEAARLVAEALGAAETA